MNLDDITPLILTYNEQANLRGTLAGLVWAKEIRVVDSGSTDDTLQIASEFPSVVVTHRDFDHFADQCNHGLSQVKTRWVLSLDADYRCDEAFRREIETLDETFSGFQARFRYAVYGFPLRAALYPPRIVLYQPALACYERDGHAHRVHIKGVVGKMATPIIHDDQKPLSHWFASQIKYANLEVQKLNSVNPSKLGWKDRLRQWTVFAPVLTLFYCLFAKRLILDGWRGVFYSFQRAFAEMVLSLILIDQRLRK
ncbi:glycosyltransferase family 2 protein [Rhodopirellula sp. P2]|uniref:glycosyltransferase family 2 protein n=1 Tax=Rhodopirellula sp. P2 TaxID=2127060 RepID=UPI0023678740|nr:glycosyltransferase family 2 protein [Rhodopirellula sp. P2]WDQ15660.1 glycosyltransferase family 2 protein [Rhodopirellula sp. P2]